MMKPNFMRKKISAQKIYRLLFNKFGVPQSKNFIFGISDRWFYLPSEEEVMKIVRKDNTNRQQYVPEVGDCDNFAYELRSAFGRKAWAVGILYVNTSFGLHAVFFFIDDNEELHVVEPQSDQPFTNIKQLFGVIMY